MIAVRESNYTWPGFRYEEWEWKLMEKFSAPVSGGDYIKFILINTVLFIVLAGIVIVGAFLPILLLIYPNPADTQALPFTLLLAASAFLSIGFGLPFTMRIASWLSSNKEMRAKFLATPEVERLNARVSWQLMRMTLIMCGILVPGMLLWISFDINGGPILAVLKFILALLFIGSVATTALRKKPS